MFSLTISINYPHISYINMEGLFFLIFSLSIVPGHDRVNTWACRPFVPQTHVLVYLQLSFMYENVGGVNRNPNSCLGTELLEHKHNSRTGTVLPSFVALSIGYDCATLETWFSSTLLKLRWSSQLAPTLSQCRFTLYKYYLMIALPLSYAFCKQYFNTLSIDISSTLKETNFSIHAGIFLCSIINSQAYTCHEDRWS